MNSISHAIAPSKIYAFCLEDINIPALVYWSTSGCVFESESTGRLNGATVGATTVPSTGITRAAIVRAMCV